MRCLLRRAAVFAGVSLVAASVSVPAAATLLTFNLSGSRDATFQLNSDPTPSSFSSSAFGDQIQFANVAGTFNGVAGSASNIGFGSGPIFATLNIQSPSLGFTQFAGPNLFSGTAAAPRFSAGTFALTSIVSGASTLTISAAVTEPATWAMMLGGFGMVGFALRRRAAALAPIRI